MKFLIWLLFVLSLIFVLWSFESIEYETKEQNLTKQLKQKLTSEILETSVRTALKEEKFDDVLMYRDLAQLVEINLSNRVLLEIESHNGLAEQVWRDTKAFASGFIDGEAEGVAGLSGSIVSDMTLYGDLRDLKNEGSKYLQDKPYDSFLLNISMLGIGLSASQLFSVGVTTPLKVGASVLKAAKKAGKLTKSFTKIVVDSLCKSVDKKVLKNINFKNISSLKTGMKQIEKSIHIKPLKRLFFQIDTVKKNTSMTDTIALMQYVDSAKELKKIGKISKKYKQHTKGVMKVLGKSALHAGKNVLKITQKLIYAMLGSLLSFLGFVLTLLVWWRRKKQQ
jgi:hypothetical protein